MTASTTPAVTGEQADKITRVAYDVIRAWQLANDEPSPAPPWEDAGDDRRASIRHGVLFALGGGTPEQQHDEWQRSRKAAGWTWGPEKDETRRLHPNLVPYSELPAAQRVKDSLFISVVTALASA